MGKYSHPPVSGAINREPMTDNYRVIRVNDYGHVYIASVAGYLNATIYGLDGSGAATAYRNYVWRPSNAGTGFNGNVTAIAATAGPLTVGKHYQFFTTTAAWFIVGPVGVTAAVNDMPMPASSVYSYLPTAGFEYISFIRISADGNYYIGRMEP